MSHTDHETIHLNKLQKKNQSDDLKKLYPKKYSLLNLSDFNTNKKLNFSIAWAKMVTGWLHLYINLEVNNMNRRFLSEICVVRLRTPVEANVISNPQVIRSLWNSMPEVQRRRGQRCRWSQRCSCQIVVKTPQREIVAPVGHKHAFQRSIGTSHSTAA